MKRRAAVTGGTRGIGRAILDTLVLNDFEVWTCGVRLESPNAEITKYVNDGLAHYIQTDLSTDAGVNCFIDFCPQVDVLVNNAGVSAAACLEGIHRSMWDETMSLNLTAPFLLMQHYLPGMAARGCGRVVNIASVSGKFGRATRACYAASKHGLIGLSRALAHEYGRHGVTINCVCPGATRTEMLEALREQQPAFVEQVIEQMPLGRLVELEEVAAIVIYLLSENASAIQGQSIMVDGGMYQA